jgi:hypothetical protein
LLFTQHAYRAHIRADIHSMSAGHDRQGCTPRRVGT